MLNYSVLPNLFALAALVFVFRSMLHRHAGDQLHNWLRGWTFVLLYFVARLLDVGQDTRHHVMNTVALLLIEVSGVAFVRAASLLDLASSGKRYLAVWMFSLLAYTALAGASIQQTWPYWLATACMCISSTLRNLKVSKQRTRADNFFSFLFLAALPVSLSVLTVLHRMENGSDVTLTWLFLMAGIRYAQRFPRKTTGVMTAVGGFIAWALVHPLGVLVAHYEPGISLQDAFWGIPKYMTAIGILLTFLEVQIDRAEHLALHDPLTGLPNRRLFEDRLQKALERAERNGTRAAVLQVDMNGFKQINDSYGHAVGDVVLCALAARLEGRIRKADTIARTGGDEFTVLISDLNHAVGADALAEILQEEMKQPVTIITAAGEKQVVIGGSVGLAVYPDHALSADELCNIADAAMYESKRRMKSLVPIPQ